MAWPGLHRLQDPYHGFLPSPTHCARPWEEPAQVTGAAVKPQTRQPGARPQVPLSPGVQAILESTSPTAVLQARSSRLFGESVRTLPELT